MEVLLLKSGKFKDGSFSLVPLKSQCPLCRFPLQSKSRNKNIWRKIHHRYGISDKSPSDALKYPCSQLPTLDLLGNHSESTDSTSLISLQNLVYQLKIWSEVILLFQSNFNLITSGYRTERELGD